MTAEKMEEGYHVLSTADQYREKVLTGHFPSWVSLRVQAFQSSGRMEAFETAASSEQLVVVTTKGRGRAECFSGGFWRGAAYHPGTAGMTPSGETSRMRWQPLGAEALETLHLYIPTHVFAGAADEFRRIGLPLRGQALNALSFYDPTVLQVALALENAQQMGATDLYAQSAAQFLATHLISVQSGWPDASEDKRRPGTLSHRKLAHVLDYIHIYYKETLSLDRLAEEAGISCFHFARLFKQSVGITPHHYLVNVRMEAAASLLGRGDLSVLEIALECGYQSAAHFSMAFRKHFSCSPSQYRV